MRVSSAHQRLFVGHKEVADSWGVGRPICGIVATVRVHPEGCKTQAGEEGSSKAKAKITHHTSNT